jgi:hypothetical protein
MKRVITAATLTAIMGLGLACPPAIAQDYDAELADRLRAAIDAQQSADDPLGLRGDGFALPEQEFLDAEELDDLVAPVALYPDALLAQVLVAATFPFQVAKADQVIDASSELTDEELSDALAAQEWDPSILVLLSGFPTVIGRMAEDLAWTERLGLAMLEQDQDVLAAVQRMRARAEATGYLTSNEAQVIERQEDQIYIRPANPDLVYVPSYDTAAAFTSPATAAPYYAPQPYDYAPQPQAGFSAQDALIGGAIGFGSALLVNELFGNDDEDEDDEGWDDYWGRPGAIDWREREVYPRAYRREIRADAREAAAWSAERDRYWDRAERRWRRDDAEARRDYEQERRGALERLERRERQASRDVRDWREGLRAEERRREQRQERREDRTEDAQREAERDAARREAERRDGRQDARQEERQDTRQEERQDARQQEREREQRQARETERQQEREREQRQARETERQQEREREQRQAREAERQQEREREQRRAREAERQQERAGEQERAREGARQQERQQDNGGGERRAREQERAREGERARSPERRSDEQRREERRERRRECREGDENCRQQRN